MVGCQIYEFTHGVGHSSPPEYDSFLAALAEQPENVRAMWHYSIALVLIHNEKARTMGTRVEDGREFLAVRTIAGDEFENERPAMSEETKALLLKQIREIVSEDQDQ